MNKERLAICVVLTTALSFVFGSGGVKVAGSAGPWVGSAAYSPEERLHTLSIAYERSVELGDPVAELAALYPYLNEARRQGNVTEQSYALVQRLCLFFNNDMEDSLFHYYPVSIEFFRRHGRWGSYYYAALLAIESYMYTNRPVMAMDSAGRLYREARDNGNVYGMGASSYLLGKIHKTGGNFRDAESHLAEAIRLLEGETDPTILFKSYDTLWEVYYDQGLYREALDVLKRFERAVVRVEAAQARDGDYISPKITRFYCYCGFVRVYSRLGQLDEAASFLAMAGEHSVALHLFTDFLHKARSVYLEESGEYEQAIESLRMSFPSDGIYRDPREGYTQSVRHSRLLSLAGRHSEAAASYEQALAYADRLQGIGLRAQLEDMEKLYEMDRKGRRARTVQMVAGVVILCLSAVFGVYFVYSFRLRRKNIALSGQLKEVNRLRSWQLSHLSHTGKPKSSDEGEGSRRKNEELVWLACRKMVEEKSFRDPSLNRKQLAAMLGTNENYLASAIRGVNGGQTVGDFINGFRLDYACTLITQNPDMTLEAVACESGLVTRSTLFRLFLKKFGMSPSQYRTGQLKERNSD